MSFRNTHPFYLDVRSHIVAEIVSKCARLWCRVYDFWAYYRLPITGRPALAVVLEARRQKKASNLLFVPTSSCDEPAGGGFHTLLHTECHMIFTHLLLGYTCRICGCLYDACSHIRDFRIIAQKANF